MLLGPFWEYVHDASWEGQWWHRLASGRGKVRVLCGIICMLAAVGQVGLQPVIGDHVSLLLSPVMPFSLFVLLYTLL